MLGWIKLHRSILEWEWYSRPHTREMFVHLLLTVNHKPSRWFGKDVLPGQRVYGRIELAAELGISERNVRTAIEQLKISGEVTSKAYSKFSIITVVNWSTYQIDDQQMTSNRPASDHILRSKEGKKERNNPLTPTGEFDKFWDTFPRQRRGDKDKAHRAWGGALKKATESEIMAGLSSYRRSVEVAEGYGKGAAAWLNDSRWTHEYEQTETTGGFGGAGL